MAPRKHPGRCGCESSWTFDDAQENPSCCEHALSAPCWYALSAECHAYWATRYYTEELGSVREPLFGQPLGLPTRGGCHFLAKECITGCSWGDRWTTTAFGYETPVVAVTNCPTATVCDDVTTPPDSDGLEDTTASFFEGQQPEASPCGITCAGGADCVPCSWANFCNGAEFTELNLQRCINNVVGDALLRKKWEMTMISATEAALTCTSNMGWTAQYYCSDFDPFNKSTFVRSNCHEMLIGLPVRICCIPISKSVANPCETIGDKCRCNDPGFCSTTIWVQVAGCSGFSGRQIIGLSRMYSVGTGMTGVTMPSPAPCGFFWGTVGGGGTSCNGYYSQMGVQIWCNGTTYLIAVYCLKTDNTWEFVPGAAITRVISTCFGPEILFTIPSMPCCCEEGGDLIPTCCCPDNDTPSTLTIEFFDGTMTSLGSAAITYNGSAWVGTLTFCGTTDATISLACSSGGEGGCEWTLVTSNGFSNVSVGTVCDPLMITFESGAITGTCFGDTITAVVTE